MKLKKGDIILTSNECNIFGKIISLYTGGNYIHAMLYVGEWDGQKMILESTYGGVRYTTLKAYKNKKICVLRSELCKKVLDNIVDNARKDIGRKYDYKGLLGYIFSDIFYAITSIRKSYESADKLFCSELIKHHYEHVGGLDLTGKPSCNSSPMDLYWSNELNHIYEGGIEHA